MAIPTDPRSTRDFQVIKGLTQTLWRNEYPIRDYETSDELPETDVEIGTPLRAVPSESNINAYVTNADDTDIRNTVIGVRLSGAIEDRVLGIAWGNYDEDPDAAESERLTVLQGNFYARVSKDWFETAPTSIILGDDEAAAGDVPLTANFGTLAVGRDVFAVATTEDGDSIARYCTAPIAYDNRYLAADDDPERCALMLDNAIIGKVVEVETDHVIVNFVI